MVWQGVCLLQANGAHTHTHTDGRGLGGDSLVRKKMVDESKPRKTEGKMKRKTVSAEQKNHRIKWKSAHTHTHTRRCIWLLRSQSRDFTVSTTSSEMWFWPESHLNLR